MTRSVRIRQGLHRIRLRWVPVHAFAAAVGFCGPLVSTPSFAETVATSPTNDATERADARYKDGVRAFQAGRFKDAIDRFNEADAILPSPALSFNTALAYERLLDSAGALGHYREYLRRDPKTSRADAIQQKIRALEAELATRGVQQVTLRSDPPGATVLVDDKPLGVTPWMGVLQPGPHAVQLRLREYYDFSQRFVLSRDHAVTLEFRLNPAAEPKTAAEPPLDARVGGKGDARERAQSGHSSSVWPWVAFGGSAASFLVAGGFELARERAEKRAKGDKTQIGFDEASAEADTRRDNARIFAGIGGGLAVTGAVLWFALPRSEKDSSAALACSGEGCFGSWKGKF